MQFADLGHFIKSHLRYKQHWNKKVIGLTDAVWQTLTEDTWIDGVAYAKDSQFKVFETSNFGWIVFHPDTKTPDGKIPGKRIIKW
jgi:hypothetical protein